MAKRITYLKSELDRLYQKANTIDFIPDDPISIPHQFSLKQDIEIAGFFAAIFAWGQRKTIINKTNDLLHRMDNSPYDFIKNHTEADTRSLEGFAHRTFNDTDLLYVVYRLQRFYKVFDSLEPAFCSSLSSNDDSIEKALIGFKNAFFDVDFSPRRTEKHIATPARNSTCKRLCMYLRWMVRNDSVDFGLWKTMKPAQLMMPYDVHVERMAKHYSLVTRKQRDWKTVIELTENLRLLDHHDPVKYDFALFGSSVMQ